jgi:polysaccharide export outer membrane protein
MRNLLFAAMLLFVGTMPAAQVSTYTVGPHDVLTIAVFEQPSLSGKFSVEADGTFTFPLLGRIRAGGLTLRDFESELRRLLAEGYLKNPQVSVTVEENRSHRIFVVGEVRTAGTYPLSGEMTIIEALARAGPLTDRAASEVVVVRAPSGVNPETPQLPAEVPGSEIVRVDLKQLQNGTPSQNIRLRDGDTLFVPRAENIFVFGQVKNPGAYPVQGNTTVLQALSMAGGVTDRASTTRLRIVRTVDGKKQEVKVKLEDLVQPGDTILVSERFF